MVKTDPRYKGLKSATKPRGRNKPARAKLAQKESYRAGYARKGHRSGKRKSYDVGTRINPVHNGAEFIYIGETPVIKDAPQMDPYAEAWYSNGALDRANGKPELRERNITQWLELPRDVRAAYMRGYVGN